MTNAEINDQLSDIQQLWSGVRRAEVMQQVRRIMRLKGIKNKDMAERMGMHEGSVCRLLKGLENVHLDTLYKIADALQEPLSITIGKDV